MEEERIDGTWPRRYSSTRPSWKANWKLPDTLPELCTTRISNRVPGIPSANHLEFVECLYIRRLELEPIPQFKATAKLGEFLEARFCDPCPALREEIRATHSNLATTDDDNMAIS